MAEVDLLGLNAEEVRRRSLIVWNGIPPAALIWRPDPAAMSCGEMVRHVLEGEYLYMLMIRNRASVAQDNSPFAGRPFTSVADEVAFARPYREQFLSLISSIEPSDLTSITIDRSDAGYQRKLGDFVLRVAYHESVHCGQMLGYLRMMDADRPRVWD
jgi:uncharacterized damage-inducible protein DinB